MDRLWLIQCKREKVIGPKKLKSYLDKLPQNGAANLYGVLFVAACDFSKAARDLFRLWCAQNGITEAHIWGKGEIEDLLFQPYNDRLLFAYFGISLSIRRTSYKTSINHAIALKRKIKRIDEKNGFTHFLVRDPTDVRYPYREGEKAVRWITLPYKACGFAGVQLEWKRFPAFVDGDQWDVANFANDLWVNGEQNDPWGLHKKDEALNDEASKAWHAFDEANKAWFTYWIFVPYEKIIAIDDVGDEVTSLPHMLTLFEKNEPPRADYYICEIKPIRRFTEEFEPILSNRITKFPDKVRRIFPGEENGQPGASTSDEVMPEDNQSHE